MSVTEKDSSAVRANEENDFSKTSWYLIRKREEKSVFCDVTVRQKDGSVKVFQAPLPIFSNE